MHDVPVLEIDGVLLASIQSDLTDGTVTALREQLLERAAAVQAAGVIIDISAVKVVDSYLARVLTEIAQSVGLLAARTVVAGMSPAVAITLVEMGLELPGLSTARSLGHALAMMKPYAREPDPAGWALP